MFLSLPSVKIKLFLSCLTTSAFSNRYVFFRSLVIHVAATLQLVHSLLNGSFPSWTWYLNEILYAEQSKPKS